MNINELILERTKDKLEQTFVMRTEVKDDKKSQFRQTFLEQLEQKIGGKYRKRFEEIAAHLDQNGAIVFGALLSDFSGFLEEYTAIMNSAGSKTWLHSFVNLANFPEFMNSTLHPLLISLIAYQMGGMVRIADCRAKDVEPGSFLGSDSRLHIDGSPFEERYHILFSWEKDKTSGPKGQNFAFIPGSHKGVRNCFVNSKNEPWASENGNIFITEERVSQVFDVQKKVLNLDSPLVIEACYPEKPLTILFDAASLAHHRYRNTLGSARSSIAIAFRRSDDCQNNLLEHAADIALMIDRLDHPEDSAKIIEHHHLTQITNIETWKKIITEAPDIEEKKKNAGYLPLNEELTFDHLVKMIMLDKHGTLDLIFYSDSHEQIRQKSRIQLREMKQDQIESLLKPWKEAIKQPTAEDLLTPKELQELAFHLAEKTQCPSLKQFLLDLGEAITRADHRQTYLTTCLFLFLACNEKKLLANYIATAILIQKQVQIDFRNIP